MGSEAMKSKSNNEESVHMFLSSPLELFADGTY